MRSNKLVFDSPRSETMHN